MLHAIAQSPWVEQTGWVLVHSLWQFTLVALLAGGLQWAMRRRSAAARYAALLAAMLIVVALPAATWFVIAPNDKPAGAGVPALAGLSGDSRLKAELQRTDSPPQTQDFGTLPPPMPIPALPDSPPAEIAETPQPAPVPEDAAPTEPVSWFTSLKTRVQQWLPAVVLVWLAGVALFAFRPLLSWYTVLRLRRVGVSPVADCVREALDRTAKKLRLARAVAVLQSTLVKTPLVVGYFRPLILLPLSVATGLPESQLELILAHELAHIRRHDYLVNLLQTLVETLFFYHPAVWWLSRQIRQERENCCDDVAISLSGNRADYGRALLAIEELRAAVPALSVAAGGGGSLVARIHRIAGQQRTPRAAGGIVLAALMVPVAALALVLWGSAPAAEKPRANDPPDKTAAKIESSNESSEPRTTLDSILRRLAEEEKRYDPIDITATTTYQHLHKESFKGLTQREEGRERSVIAGSRLYYERANDTVDDDGKKTSTLLRQAFDGLWSRQCGQGMSGEVDKHAWGTIGLDRKDEILLLRGHTLLFHNESGVKGQLLSAYLGSGWSDAAEQYAMTVEYLGDERTDGLDCHKLKCAVPMHGKVDLYFLLWLARDRNLLPVRREWRENRVNMFLPTGIQCVTKLREVRPGQWFPTEATEIAYAKEALRNGELALQWRRDVRIGKVSLGPPADEKLFSSVEAPEGTSIAVYDRSSKGLGKFKQPRTENIEISLDRFHAMQRAAAANEEDEYDPKDATAPKRKQRIDAAYAVLRADPSLAQDNRIEAALTILQNFGVFQTNAKKWATAIRELITIGKPALPPLIDELDHIDRASRPETELRALGFVLRGIRDPRAVPALIRAIPYALQPPRSDFGCSVDDPELMAFMRQHDNDNGSSAKRFSFGRPINELLPALQKLTGVVAVLPTEDGGREFGSIRHVFVSDDAHKAREQRQLFLRFAERWAGWWAKNWKQFVNDEKDAQLDETRAALEKIGRQITPAPGEAKAEATPKALPPMPKDQPGKPSASTSDGKTIFAGLCHDEHGRPIAGAEVFLYRVELMEPAQKQLQTVRTDRAGQFRFAPVADLAKNLSAEERSIADFAPYWIIAKADGRATVCLCDPPDDPRRLDLRMLAGATLSGTITGPDGKPVKGAVVTPFLLPKPVAGLCCATTDEQGHFTIGDLEVMDVTLPPEAPGGTYSLADTLFISCRGFADKMVDYGKVPGKVDARLDLAAVVEGRVVNGKDGGPAAGVRVRCQGINEPGWGGWGGTHTDQNGRYRFDSLGPYKYNIWASADGYTMRAIDSFEAVRGTTKSAPDIQLVRGGFIVGHVVDADTGQPFRPSDAAAPPGYQPDVAMYGPARPRSGAACEAEPIQEDGSFKFRAAPGINQVCLRIFTRTQAVPPDVVNVDVTEGQTVKIEFEVRRKPVAPKEENRATSQNPEVKVSEEDRKMLLQEIDRHLGPEAWKSLLMPRFDKDLLRTKLKVVLSAPKAELATVRARSELKKQDIDVCVLPVTIENKSSQPIRTSLAHEWYGGIWPPTDLYAAVLRPAAAGRKADVEFKPVFLGGDRSELTKPTVVVPGKSTSVSPRLDWPGTGSVMGGEIVYPNRPGVYVVMFMLVFQTDGVRQYVVSEPIAFHYQQPDKDVTPKPAALKVNDPAGKTSAVKPAGKASSDNKKRTGEQSAEDRPRPDGYLIVPPDIMWQVLPPRHAYER